jgi:hypothetical protein
MFEVVDRKTSPTGVAVPPDGMTIGLRKSPAGSGLFLMARLGVNLVSKIGWLDGQQIEVAWGTGTHDGQLQMRGVERKTGYSLKRGKRTGWNLGLGQRSGQLVDEPRPPQVATVETLRDERAGETRLVVTLPRNFLRHATVATLAADEGGRKRA